MIILNEKKYVEDILRDKSIEPSKTYTFLNLYARYLYHEQGCRKTGILRELQQFMETHYPNYNPVDWTAKLEGYAAKAGKYPLCQCNGIWITKKELETIHQIQDKVLERLAFTLLCLAKFRNFRNGNNHGWINYSNGEIYSMACINTSAFNKDMKFFTLKELGLIEYAKNIKNLNIRVLFVHEDSKNELFVSDFRKPGYEWRLYCGEKYIRCAECGLLIKNTNGRRRYCKECAENRNRARTLQRYHAAQVPF